MAEDIRVFHNIVDGVKDLLGIHSPSLVFAGIGKNMGLGLADGITGSVSLVDRAMNKLNAAVDGAKADMRSAASIRVRLHPLAIPSR